MTTPTTAWCNLAVLTTPFFAEVASDRCTEVRPIRLTAYLQQTLISTGARR